MADAAPDRPAIAIDRLTKRYGRLTAVRELSLTVERGEIFGFLGLTLDATGALGPLVQALAGLPVADLEVQAPHLEDVLVRYYREGEAS